LFAIKVLISGASGKMGRAMAAGIVKEKDMRIVAAVDVRHQGAELDALCGLGETGLLLEDDLAKAIRRASPDVMLDFTNPQAVMKNIVISLQNRVAPVVGTTGLSERDLAEIALLSEQFATPVFIAANFALGAVLMMRFAQEAAPWFPHAEIIERHGEHKMDAPSGTALVTLEKISQAREIFSQGSPNEFEKIPGARGGDYQGMRVHSVRLPGYVATQEVVFGGLGQVLTIRHDSMSRESFLPGVLLALRKVRSLSGLVCGLENIL